MSGRFPDPASFTCDAVLGVSVTGDWFGAGFETGLPGDKWQVAAEVLRPSCAVFQTNSPHFADRQAAVVAKVYRDYFLPH